MEIIGNVELNQDITDGQWISECDMTKRKKDNVIIILHVNEHGDLV